MDIILALTVTATVVIWILNIADVIITGRDDDDDDDNGGGGYFELALEYIPIPVPVDDNIWR